MDLLIKVSVLVPRRKLMELDSHLLGLKMAAEQQHAIISQWESRNNKLYKNTKSSTARHPSGTDNFEVNDDRGKYNINELYWSSNNQSHLGTTDFLEEIENDAAMQQAWAELAEISREQERYAEMRANADRELENCRQRSLLLEDVSQRYFIHVTVEPRYRILSYTDPPLLFPPLTCCPNQNALLMNIDYIHFIPNRNVSLFLGTSIENQFRRRARITSPYAAGTRVGSW